MVCFRFQLDVVITAHFVNQYPSKIMSVFEGTAHVNEIRVLETTQKSRRIERNEMFVISNDLEENVFEGVNERVRCLGTRGVDIFGDDGKNNATINEGKEIFDEEGETHDVVQTSRITFNKQIEN